MHTDSSYLSASDVRVHFGLGERSDVRGLMVQWPDGSSETWDHVKPNRRRCPSARHGQTPIAS